MKSRKSPNSLGLPFTGERYVPELRGTIALEHLHRYAYACQFVKDRVVLDVACGEGYGSEMLARTAQKVYGVDIDKATIAHAKQKYSSKKLKFIEGSCEKIPLEDHCVDVVVSFETLEHTTNHSQTLREFKRILKPRGLVIISSPEKEAYGASRPEQNPFHVKELDRCGLETILLAQFRHIQIVGQSVLSGSFITSSEVPLSFGPRFEFSKLPGQGSVAKGLPNPIYLIALCTDGDLPTVSASYCRQLVSESEDYQQLAETVSSQRVRLEARVGERTEWAKRLERELQEARRSHAEAHADAEEKVKWAKSLEAELGKLRVAFGQEQKMVAERTEWAKKLEQELAGARRVQVEAVKDAEEKVKWARGLEKEVVAAQRTVEQAQGDAREKVKWAKSLEAELGKLRVAFGQEQKMVAERTEWAKKLEQELAGARRVQVEAVKDAEEKVKWAKKLQEELAAAQAGYRNLERELQESAERTKKLETDLASEKQLAMERTLRVSRLEEDVEAARRSHERAAAEAQDLRAQLQEVLGSSCWRLTAPLRSAVSMAKNSINAVRRYAISLLAWKSLKTGLSFDRYWYVREHEDVGCYRLGPLLHLLLHGMFEGRTPNRRFSTEAYLLINPDVATYPLGPVVHYFLHGHREGRLTNWLDRYVESNYGRDARIRISALMDLLLTGEGCVESSDFRRRKLGLLASRLAKAVAGRRNSASPVKVSVIIPVYNQVFHTMACLISLFESDPLYSFEVIIADDCSTDETNEIFGSLSPCIKLVRTRGNLGFLRNCNYASRAARGEYFLFLNNDTIVLPDCLDALVDVLRDEQCGAAGAKLLNLDGTLQEAGGVIWRDFEGWNYGRGANPWDPTYNYRRSTDYCSGSCLMVPRVVFENLGGFSTELEVAYGEDSDLCMSIRHRLNRDVVYEPRASLVHFEGQSCGTSLDSGVKRYQVVNKEILARKWAPVTDTFTPAADEHAQSGPRRHMGWPRVCLIDHYLPRFDRESGSRRLMTILKILRSCGCHVYFLADNMFAEEPYAAEVRRMGVELLVGAPGFSAGPEQLLTDRRTVIDLVWCVRPEMTHKWLRFFRDINPHIKIVFDTGDIHHLRLRAEEKMLGLFVPELSPSEDMRRREEQLCREADLTVAISEAEAKILAGMGAARVEVVSGIYSDCTRPGDPNFSDREGLLFVGSAHTPNTDGILWFLERVWPLVRAHHTEIEIDLVGTLDQRVRSVAGDGVRVSGHVPDLAERFRRARVFVSPLRFGAGVKGKLGQCIEFGLPFVTTPVGADGMSFTHEKDALICADPASFAEGISRLYYEEQLWLRIRKNLASHLENYSPEKAREGLEAILALVPGYRSDHQL